MSCQKILHFKGIYHDNPLGVHPGSVRSSSHPPLLSNCPGFT
jgi:hypothetical protein